MRTVPRNGELVSKVELFRLFASRNPVAVLYYEPRRPRGACVVAGHGYSSSKQNLDLLCSFLSSHGFGVYSLDFPGHKLGCERWRAARRRRLHRRDVCGRQICARARVRRNVHAGTQHGGNDGDFHRRPRSADFRDDRNCDRLRAPNLPGGTAKGRRRRFSLLVCGWGHLARARCRRRPPLRRTARASGGRPSLYVAANRDAMVSPKSVRELYDRAPEPKSFATIESDHTYAAEHARAAVLEWLNEHRALLDWER